MNHTWFDSNNPIDDFNDHNLTTMKIISSAHIFIIYYIICIYIAEWDFKRIRSRSGSFNGVILELNHNNFWKSFCPWPDLSKNDLFNEIEFWFFEKMRKTVWIQRRYRKCILVHLPCLLKIAVMSNCGQYKY